ncbi:7-cyano-7-deazaguanine synthase [Mucilaginibacter sp.]|uniref:7-cyano-7-deazaguanine synthase n=1 Tax=Mucilaginibacter sp. TaxID=1882438 RepID=UPI0032641FC7
MKKAILLSGGLDSLALTYWYRKDISVAITVNYGQKTAEKEIEVSAKICKELSLRHEIIEIDCSSLGSGEMCPTGNKSISEIPEWWPYRNQLLITLACMKLIHYKTKHLLFGAVKTDNRFVDGTMEFFNNFNNAVSMQEGG